MKPFLLLLSGCLVLSAGAQYLNAGLDLHAPLQDQRGKLKNAYGFTAGYGHPVGKTPFYALLDISGSVFDYQEMEQHLPGPNGHITHQEVEYASNVSLFTAGMGWAPLREKKVSPYLAVKGGYIKHRTTMTLYDADDPDGCRPADRKSIVRDFTPVAVAAGGLRVQLPVARMPRLDFGANYITGGTSRYLRMRKSDEPPAPDADPYLVKFEHLSSGEVHEHALGDVFTTHTRQLQLYIKVMLPLKNNCREQQKSNGTGEVGTVL